MNLEKIKVGDTVIISNRWTSKLKKVTRLTKTLIICDDEKYSRLTGISKNSNAWDFSTLKIATDEDIKKFHLEKRKKSIINFIKSYDYEKLSYDKIEKIYQILSK